MANAAPTHDRPPDHSHRRCIRAVGITRAEHAADDHLARDRNRIQDEREKEEKLRRDLMRRELWIAHPGANRRCHEKRRIQGGRPHEDLPADAHHRPHCLEARPLRAGVWTQQLDGERHAHADLRDCRPRRRPGDAPMEAVHEQHLEHDVHDVRDHDDLERPPHVRDTAEIPLSRERDQSRRQADRSDPEVGDCIVA